LAAALWDRARKERVTTAPASVTINRSTVIVTRGGGEVWEVGVRKLLRFQGRIYSLPE